MSLTIKVSVCSLALIAGLLSVHRSGNIFVCSAYRPEQFAGNPHEITLNQVLQSTTISNALPDIERVNLLCAIGLPALEQTSLNQALATLSAWSDRVRSETERHLWRFRRNPSEFNHSEPYFRILTLVTVLQQDFKVRYNPEWAAGPGSGAASDSFFRDPDNVFLSGLLGDQPRGGTCASMPVLYVAVGRRLGYPLKLVTTKGHLLARWEDAREKFNIEATSQGLNCFPDEYYHSWPFKLSELEIRSGRYLRSLSPKEELAVFLQNRGFCLKAVGRYAEAREAWEKARELTPDWPEHAFLIASLK